MGWNPAVVKKAGAVEATLLVAGKACSWENEEELFGDASCNTEDASFTTDIVPLLDNYCWACHSNQNAPSFGAGIRLEDYESIRATSQLTLGAIRRDPGFSPMPKNAPKLDSCLILVFESWVNAGSPEN
jgi:hypothetical protein